MTSSTVTISAVAKLKAGKAKQEKEKMNVTQSGRFVNKPKEVKSILKYSPVRSIDDLDKEIEREERSLRMLQQRSPKKKAVSIEPSRKQIRQPKPV